MAAGCQETSGHGSRSRANFGPPDAERREQARNLMNEPALTLDDEQRRIVEVTIAAHCRIRGWLLHRVNSPLLRRGHSLLEIETAKGTNRQHEVDNCHSSPVSSGRKGSAPFQPRSGGKMTRRALLACLIFATIAVAGGAICFTIWANSSSIWKDTRPRYKLEHHATIVAISPDQRQISLNPRISPPRFPEIWQVPRDLKVYDLEENLENTEIDFALLRPGDFVVIGYTAGEGDTTFTYFYRIKKSKHTP
jgi:hypothetical protein